MPKIIHALTLDQLANLFTQLKRLETAGLPVAQAFAVLASSDHKLKQALTLMQQQLNAGRPVSEAGFKVGIFDETHRTLLEAGEITGKAAEVYGQLAAHYTELSSRVKKVK